MAHFLKGVPHGFIDGRLAVDILLGGFSQFFQVVGIAETVDNILVFG
jgi:hypothetical protein